MWHSSLLILINHVAPSTLLVCSYHTLCVVIITYKEKFIEPNTDVLY